MLHGDLFSFGCNTVGGAFSASGARIRVFACGFPTGFAGPEYRDGRYTASVDFSFDEITVFMMSLPYGENRHLHLFRAAGYGDGKS